MSTTTAPPRWIITSRHTRCKRGVEVTLGRRYAMAVEIALSIPPGNERVPLFFALLRPFSPLEKGLNTAVLGPTDFFRPLTHAGWWTKKKKRDSTQKTPKISKNYRLNLRHRTRVSPCNHMCVSFSLPLSPVCEANESKRRVRGLYVRETRTVERSVVWVNTQRVMPWTKAFVDKKGRFYFLSYDSVVAGHLDGSLVQLW